MCNERLLFKLVQIGIEFPQNVFDPGEIFTGIVQAIFRFTASFLVFGDTGGFFQKQTQLIWLAFDDSADGALPNDGIGAWPKAGAEKNVLHITAAYRLAVDVITAAAIPGQHPFDGNLGKLTPLPTCTVVVIVKNQLHTGAAGGFAGVGAVKDHILHRLAAQFRGFGFTQHPAHRVHDVGLAAAIGTHHTHQLPGQQEVGWFGE